jgi:hypothetical protein
MCAKSFHEKLTCRLAYVKKINFVAKNKTFHGTCLSFYTDHVQCRFFVKLYERLWIMEMYMQKKFVQIFSHFKIYILSIGTICSALPLEKGRTPMLSATPWITDSTTVQNILIIAIVSKLQCKSSYIGVQPCEYTAESIVTMSLYLYHVPQTDMLECRLEILLIVCHSNKPARLNMQPQRGQYNNILANYTY